jgi:hypothetical protein
MLSSTSDHGKRSLVSSPICSRNAWWRKNMEIPNKNLKGPRAVCVVILRKDDILLVETAQRPGKLSFPGGWLEDGESPFAGAVRESMEETGIALIARSEPVHVGPSDDGVIVACFLGYGIGKAVAGDDAIRCVWGKWAQVLGEEGAYPAYNEKVYQKVKEHQKRFPMPIPLK